MTETPYFPGIDDMINLPQPEDARISPDGRQVAFTISTPDWEQNERISQIWLVGDNIPEPRQLTWSKTGSWMPRWSPDGQNLAFLSKREQDADPQIYVMSPFGGEARRLTSLEGSIQTLAWSPDSAAIAFTFTEKETETAKKRKEKFGEYRVEDEDYQRAGLWLLAVGTQKVERLTGEKDPHITVIEWSPDGQKILLETYPSPDMKEYNNASVQVFDLKDGSLHPLAEHGASSPYWSPDGSQIVFVRIPEPLKVRNLELCVLGLAGGEPKTISHSFDEDTILQVWSPDGIYFSAMQRTGIHLFRIDPASGVYEQITPADRMGWLAMDYSFSSDFSQIATAAADEDHIAEIVRIDARTHAISRLTSFDEATRDWQIGRKEVIQWASQDGTLIEGVLSKPFDFDPAKKYPLLVVIHGGPTWLSVMGKLAGPECRFYPIEQWLQKGALVLQPNYRGSSGYGEKFRQLNVGNLGLGDYWDVISGVDALIEHGWVDKDRVGAMGWSQGGYISAFITTYSNRFKAVSVGAGISNWITYYVNTDIHPFTREYLESVPWDNMGVYQKTSPMTYIKSACTPTLIQHGEQDQRVPIPNAYELYQGLLDVGVEARLQVFPGMRHSSNKPRTQRRIMQSNFEWFNKWIWGEETAEETAKTAYVSLVEGISGKEVDTLPAIQRYQGKHLQEIYRHALRDQVDFYIFSGEFGLVSVDFSVPPEERPLLVEDLSAMAVNITEKLRDEGIRRVVFHTPPAEKNPWVLLYLACLQAAAGLIGNVKIEHAEYKEEK
ncbi:MAG: S9 family peptidase [Chloroflexi bacterium]|nr:S9 family peptidase [Chloroflexota bacterium]